MNKPPLFVFCYIIDFVMNAAILFIIKLTDDVHTDNNECYNLARVFCVSRLCVLHVRCPRRQTSCEKCHFNV